LAKWLLATVPAKPIEITEEIAIPCFPVIPAKSAENAEKYYNFTTVKNVRLSSQLALLSSLISLKYFLFLDIIIPLIDLKWKR